MLEREINGQKMKSLLDVFLGKYPQAVEELFDHGITTNGQDLDAVGLQLIFNFDFFFKEGLMEKFKDDDSADNYDDQNTDQVDNSKDENGNGSAVNEMAVHQKIVKSKENFLLKHPLADSFLYLKWQMIRKYFFLNIFIYWLFVFCFTTFLYAQQELYNCRSNRKVGKVNKFNFTSYFKIPSLFQRNSLFGIIFFLLIQEHWFAIQIGANLLQILLKIQVIMIIISYFHIITSLFLDLMPFLWNTGTIWMNWIGEMH